MELIPDCCACKLGNPNYPLSRPYVKDKFRSTGSHTNPPNPAADHQIALPVATAQTIRVPRSWQAAPCHSPP